VAHPSEPQVDVVAFDQTERLLCEIEFVSADELLASVGHGHDLTLPRRTRVGATQTIEPGGPPLPRRRG
jgi:hypothetical protein